MNHVEGIDYSLMNTFKVNELKKIAFTLNSVEDLLAEKKEVGKNIVELLDMFSARGNDTLNKFINTHSDFKVNEIQTLVDNRAIVSGAYNQLQDAGIDQNVGGTIYAYLDANKEEALSPGLSDDLHYLRKQFGSGLVDAYELLENSLQAERDNTDYDKTTSEVLDMFALEENDTLNKFINTHDVNENDLRELVEQRAEVLKAIKDYEQEPIDYAGLRQISVVGLEKHIAELVQSHVKDDVRTQANDTIEKRAAA